ncbi:hypothetical protein PENPOL_c001G04010 [Penicillium polonicum]|uniref:Uncharacterized protein n=1 Tax=Penicillium polonicum TaxID=60169 RepID=A0A1V6P429_PENPO|nr:hypothetical protein PENPOL_c001G04010 [Penicillium polonicum]
MSRNQQCRETRLIPRTVLVRGFKKRVIIVEGRRQSAMEPVLVKNAKLKMPIAYLVIGGGTEKRYATFLEEQQGWLIHGIRELYRHVQAGDGWPGERLNCEANGQPLVHDMLSRLGSLNQPGSTIFPESEHNMTEPTSPYHQRLQDQPGHNKQRPHSSNGSQQSFTPVQGLPTALNNILSSPTVHEGQHIEAMNTPSSSSVPDFTDAESIYIPLQIHTSSNLDESDQSYTPYPASHAGLLCNDVQPSSMLWYPTKNDSVGSDLFAGIGNHPDDWERFFNPSTQGQLSIDGYSPFYDFQPLPFEYAT